jgi:hypothetical protein
LCDFPRDTLLCQSNLNITDTEVGNKKRYRPVSRSVWAGDGRPATIPGTTCEAHLQENLGAATMELQPDLIAQLDALINQRSIVGERYNSATQAEVDTENF